MGMIEDGIRDLYEDASVERVKKLAGDRMAHAIRHKLNEGMSLDDLRALMSKVRSAIKRQT